MSAMIVVSHRASLLLLLLIEILHQVKEQVRRFWYPIFSWPAGGGSPISPHARLRGGSGEKNLLTFQHSYSNQKLFRQRCPSYPISASTRAWPVELYQLWLWLAQKNKMKKALALAPSLSSLRKARENSSFGLRIY